MKTKQAGRWAALISVLLGMSFNDISASLFPERRQIDDITQVYYTHFTPAGYTFGIWGLIYLSFIIYTIYQLLPQQKDLPLPDRISWPLAGANLLGIAWIITFTSAYITLSTLIILFMLVLACLMFHQVKTNSQNIWIHFPFSIFFGWMTSAAVTAITTWMAYSGFKAINDPNITDAFIALVCLTGILVSYLYRDLFYPAVICWTVAGIYIKNKYMVDKVATSAFIATMLMFVWVVSYTIFLYASLRKFRKLGALND